MNFLKLSVSLLDKVSPSTTARIAFKYMSNPKVRKLKAFEEEVLANAEQVRFSFKQFEIQSYRWGVPGPNIAFLIHGWEGQSGNFGALVPLLVKKGYYVIAFDGPSHGKSTQADTSMFEYADLITAMMKRFRPQVLVSHSFGSVTAVYAMINNPEIVIHQWFAITTPSNFKNRVKEIKQNFGVSDRTVNRLISLIESNGPHKIGDMNMANFGPRLHNVQEVIITHSKTDKVIPISAARSAKNSLPNSELIELDQLGHYAILWSEPMKEIIEERLLAV